MFKCKCSNPDIFNHSGRCDMKYVLLEMDRILRPKGYAIIRESNHFIDAIASISTGMRWNCQKHETEYEVEKEKLLICQKELWYSEAQWTVRTKWEAHFSIFCFRGICSKFSAFFLYYLPLVKAICLLQFEWSHNLQINVVLQSLCFLLFITVVKWN